MASLDRVCECLYMYAWKSIWSGVCVCVHECTYFAFFSESAKALPSCMHQSECIITWIINHRISTYHIVLTFSSAALAWSVTSRSCSLTPASSLKVNKWQVMCTFIFASSTIDSLSQGSDSRFKLFQLWCQFSIKCSLSHNFIMKTALKVKYIHSYISQC